MKKMGNLTEFFLCYTGKPINWDKVEKEFGKEKVNEIKTFRKIYFSK